MKMMKLALLGGAALAVTSAGAFADDLSALKAEIQALNSRVAQLEATPSIPAGYSLMTISEGPATVVPGLNQIDTKENINYGDRATIISVLPTADAPAAASVEWTGFARAAITYRDNAHFEYVDLNNNGIFGDAGDTVTQYGNNDDLDIYTRGQLKVVGKTDTAVGEVGARIQIRANAGGRDSNPGVVANEYWGWWAMTPELTLGGGWTGSLGNIGYGYDGACNCYYTDNADVALNPGDAHQMRLSYASGPISFAVAVEDDTLGTASDWNALAGAAEVKYTGDSFNGEVSGYFGDNDRWRVGAGVGFALGDMASVSAGVQIGDKGRANFFTNSDDDFWTASILASANLSDAVHAEIAYGHTDYSDRGYDVNAVLGGIYYDPVSQLTIGLEAEWYTHSSYTFTQAGFDGFHESEDNVQVDLVTVFRF